MNIYMHFLHVYNFLCSIGPFQCFAGFIYSRKRGKALISRASVFCDTIDHRKNE